MRGKNVNRRKGERRGEGRRVVEVGEEGICDEMERKRARGCRRRIRWRKLERKRRKEEVKRSKSRGGE